jgi:maltokinase
VSEPGASASVARGIVPRLVPAGVERPITVDQTNRSVVVDEAVIVKWLRPPAVLPHRGSDVLAHLDEVGFEAMPAFHGVHVDDGKVVASVTTFVAGAVDGWEWYLDEVQAWIEGSLAADQLDRRATALGGLAGRLHVALATPSSRWPEPITEVPVRALHARAMVLLDDARRLHGTRDRPAPAWDRIEEVIDALDSDRSTAAITVHGDLHVGNVLAAGDQLLVIDFDGNPIADPGTSTAQAPAVDVASLLQSIDHIGRIVDHRTAGARRADLTRFIDESVEAALAAYLAELSAASLDHLLDVELLGPLRVVQELHELAYAAAHLPHWVYVPEATLTAMFPDEKGT